MAAYVANSIGQMYVGFMVAQVGAGTTMKLGGVITELMTALFAWRIPALLTYPRGASGSGTAGGAASGGGLAAVPDATPGSGRVADDVWELNDAAVLAARGGGKP